MSVDRLFVYGTLKPGHSRWPVLAPFVDPAEPVIDDEVDGRLWATPWGWPALTNGRGTAHGVLVTLRAESVPDALARLDEIEGVDSGLFERVMTTTRTGAMTWVYMWPGDTTGFHRLATNWEGTVTVSIQPTLGGSGL